MTACSDPKGPLDGLLVLDLSRILAGPTATQMLGDLGATVLKIENPKTGGDDTRGWGPPYAEVNEGQSDLSAYFMSSNRNKYSIAADLSTEEGQRLVASLARRETTRQVLDHATRFECGPQPKRDRLQCAWFNGRGTELSMICPDSAVVAGGRDIYDAVIVGYVLAGPRDVPIVTREHVGSF